MLKLFFIMLALAAFTVILVQNNRHKTVQKVSIPLLSVAVLMLLVGVGGFLLEYSRTPPTMLSNDAKSRLFASHGFVIAEQIAINYQNEKIAIFANAKDDGPRLVELTKAITEKLGKNTVIDTILIEPELAAKYTEDDCPSYDDLMRAKDFDLACRKAPDAKFILIAAALPKDAEKMRLWTEKRKVFVIGASSSLGQKAAKFSIAGYTTLNEKADFSKLDIPADYSKAFAAKYKLVMRTN